MTPLHLAVKRGHLELVRFLLSISELDMFIKDNAGKTAFSHTEMLRDEKLKGKMISQMNAALHKRKRTELCRKGVLPGGIL